jgi:hypothetical protein
MKKKHNKKRNTAFLYESLIRELTKSIVGNEKDKSSTIQQIIKEHFYQGSVLHKELQCYQTLCEEAHLDSYTAEKLLFLAKKEYESLSAQTIFVEQSKVIRKINESLPREFYNNFVPNYKVFATIAQIFNKKVPLKSRVLMEKQLLEGLTNPMKTGNKDLKPLDSIVVKSFVKNYNEKYTELLPEQKTLLTKYILSFDREQTDLKLYLGEELSRIREQVETSLSLEEIKEDPEMITNTLKVLEKIDTLSVNTIDRQSLLQVLKMQNLVKEYEIHDN